MRIRYQHVSEETVAAVFQLMEEAGKACPRQKDVPGFLPQPDAVMRFSREAISSWKMDAEAGDVDDAIKYGFGGAPGGLWPHGGDRPRRAGPSPTPFTVLISPH